MQPLDAETTALFERTGETVRLWKDARKSGERLGEHTKEIAGIGEELVTLLDGVIVEARVALEKAEAVLD